MSVASQEGNEIYKGRGDFGISSDFGVSGNVTTKVSLDGQSWILCVLAFCYLKNDLYCQDSTAILFLAKHVII